MKTNKHQTLRLVRIKGMVQARDLVHEFGYSSATARSYLSYLGRQDLLHRVGLGCGLTSRGVERLQYFDVAGCPHPGCPLCQGKAGWYTCPRCQYRVVAQELRILPEWDLWLLLRHPGVYCPRCFGLIFSEAQALRLGIPRSTT